MGASRCRRPLKRVIRPGGAGATAIEPDWSVEPGLQRMSTFLETKTVWHPKGPLTAPPCAPRRHPGRTVRLGEVPSGRPPGRAPPLADRSPRRLLSRPGRSRAADECRPRDPRLGRPAQLERERRPLVALRTLVDTGSCELPIYDLPTSRAVGTTTLTAGPGDLILTEGIFAAELIGPLRVEGLLHSGWCIIHRHPGVNFLRRLARDLRERRKPPHILVRRGGP